MLLWTYYLRHWPDDTTHSLKCILVIYTIIELCLVFIIYYLFLMFLLGGWTMWVSPLVHHFAPDWNLNNYCMDHHDIWYKYSNPPHGSLWQFEKDFESLHEICYMDNLPPSSWWFMVAKVSIVMWLFYKDIWIMTRDVATIEDNNFSISKIQAPALIVTALSLKKTNWNPLNC